MDKEDVVYIYIIIDIDSEILLSHQKKNEILSFVITGLELEYTTLSETSQSEKDNYHLVSLICEI